MASLKEFTKQSVGIIRRQVALSKLSELDVSKIAVARQLKDATQETLSGVRSEQFSVLRIIIFTE